MNSADVKCSKIITKGKPYKNGNKNNNKLKQKNSANQGKLKEL
jgi:hypothetical protein